jgi:hypothetical protein
MPLAALFFIWVAGRAAVAFSAVIGAYPAAIALLGAQNRQCFEQAAEIRVCQAKTDLQNIWMAATRKDAEQVFDHFTDKYGTKYEKAATCLMKDREAFPDPFRPSPAVG